VGTLNQNDRDRLQSQRQHPPRCLRVPAPCRCAAPLRRATQAFREDSLPCPPPLPWTFGTMADAALELYQAHLPEAHRQIAVGLANLGVA